MLSPIGAFVTAVGDSIIGTVLLPLFILGLVLLGIMFILGNHEHAKQRAPWLFAGAGVGLLAKTIAAAFSGGFPH